MRTMSTEEWHEFIVRDVHTGKLSTVGADGAPHITPVWYVFDGEDFLFTAGGGTAKVRNLRRDPRAALCVDDEALPHAYVEVRGDVAFSENPDELFDVSSLAGARYVGPEQAEEFAERNAVPGEVVVRLHPTKVIAYSGITD